MLGKKEDKSGFYDATNTVSEKPKKKFYKQKWFWIVILVLLVIGAISNGSNDTEQAKDQNTVSVEEQQENAESKTAEEDTETTEKQKEDTEKETSEETEETGGSESASSDSVTQEEKTPFENASEMGQWWFTHADWDSVFQYKSKVHYVLDYYCQEVTVDDLKQYGTYVGIASADLQNAFGTEFKSNIYIFMDEDGVAQHVFYDQADGTSVEIPMDSIPMKNF